MKIIIGILSVVFKRLLPSLLLLLIVVVGTLLWSRSIIKDNYSPTRVGENVVDIAEYVDIGGIPQWIRVKGQDKNNPILVFLHGGPGGAASGYSYSFQHLWEDYFTVVQWDQRGAGRSIPEGGFPVETMTVERMLLDTVELIEHLRSRFGHEKVFVVGHSWGTVLGTLVANRRPDLLYAYVGIGQLVSWQENFEETRRLLIEYAREQGDQEVVDKLLAAGQMPDPADTKVYDQWIDTVQTPLFDYDKKWYNKGENGVLQMILTTLLSPDMTLNDLRRFRSNDGEPYRYAILQDAHNFDVRKIGYKFDVPMIQVMGKHDWVTPVTLARDYFKDIDAPYKKYIELENSAHLVFFEEPGKLFSVLINEALPFAQPDSEFVIK